MVKPPSYAFWGRDVQGEGLHGGMTTSEITIAWPAITLFNGVVSVTETTFPDSLMALIEEAWLGRLMLLTGPNPLPAEVWNAGVKYETVSVAPTTLPTPAT